MLPGKMSFEQRQIPPQVAARLNSSFTTFGYGPKALTPKPLLPN
jgi:hypothetical protein